MATRFTCWGAGTAIAVLWLTSPPICAGDTPTLATLRALAVPQGQRTIRLWLAMFDENVFRLRLIDNAGRGDLPRFETLAEAVEASDCVAGCNGGFFNRSPFDPAGLMISNGNRYGAFDPASWQKGMVVVRNGRASLEAIEKFDPNSGVAEALQSGPWLVRAGRSEPSPAEQRPARRTFICCDDHGVWAIGVCDVCSLQELAVVLRHKIVTDVIDVQLALNLDGGPSTGLWVKR